ncbi:MAG TPA: hypothetical protein PKH29_12880 [Oscillospiraceae bacterium]|nr:hypothetical protein [Oscillospiraceae bacterium]
MILQVETEVKPKLTVIQLESMSLYEIIRDERAFVIIIDGKTFFTEPLFPILEFVQYSIKWVKENNVSFIYNTIESEENPILSFTQQQGQWKIYSVWQKFECNELFKFEDIRNFIIEIINRVMQ